MGMESFDLVCVCPVSASAIGAMVEGVAREYGVGATSTVVRQWEIVGPDFVAQVKLDAGQGASESRISIRTAICCSEEAVELMRRLGRVVCAASEGAVWTIFGDRTAVDLLDPGASDVLIGKFRQKRDRLLATMGLSSIVPAKLRPGMECIEYIERMRA